jgi:hypothetical protein
LAIQIANQKGLYSRLAQVEILNETLTLDQRVDYAIQQFGQ